MDWIGSGFGVSPELLKFWTKNDFYPVHITPHRNEISGEHTLIVLKALNKSINKKLKQINSEFTRRLLEYLGDELRDIETKTAMGLLQSILKDAPIPKPKVNDADKKRLEKYFEGLSLYEYVSDIVRPIVRYFYSRLKKPELDEHEHEITIGKCLQFKKWSELHNDYKSLQKSIQKIWEWYDGENKL
jgi:tRNA(Met) cytidine acetyltransferase